MRIFFAKLMTMFLFPRNFRHRVRDKIMAAPYKKAYNQIKSQWLAHNDGKLLLPGRFSEYDLVIGIGSTCLVTDMLKSFNLRRFTTPFDWTAGMEPINWLSQPGIYRDTRFREKIQAICDNFKDWTNPKYFKYVSTFNKDKHHNIVNVKTHIRYLHEFPADQDILQYFPQFVTKTSRRIQNLYNALNNSKTVLIVWLSRTGDQCGLLEKNVSYQDIKWAVNKMQKQYPAKQFDFVFFEHDGTKNRFEYEKINVTENAFKIKSNHFLNDFGYNFINILPDWRPHIHVISEMLDNIKLSKQAFALKPES